MFKYVKEINKSLKGKKITLRGWIHEVRDLANVKFILLRDSTGIIQCTIKKNTPAFNKFYELSLESVIEISGKLEDAVIKSPDVTIRTHEIEISDLKLLNKAEPLPIQIIEKNITTGLSKRLDYRSLDIRKAKIKAIFKIQSTLVNGFREFFHKSGFIEIQPPGIIGTSTEGGTNLFKTKYFEKDAFLAQSPQLYKQLCSISWDRVFSTSPVWRAEKHNTVRHLTEVRQMDIEVAFEDQFGAMKWQEEVVKYMIKKVLEECKEEIKLLDLKLKIPKIKYLSYKEAIELLKKNKMSIKYGEDFDPENEKKISELFEDTLVFIHSWPNSLKPFYIWPIDRDVSGGFDSIYGGIELSSGGQRIHIPDILIENIKRKGLDPKDFKWYIDSFRWGAPMHSGWSIGLERLTMAICNLDNIREACLFPRDRDRLTP
jgi:aspartyl-tRNA synthetase